MDEIKLGVENMNYLKTSQELKKQSTRKCLILFKLCGYCTVSWGLIYILIALVKQ